MNEKGIEPAKGLDDLEKKFPKLSNWLNILQARFAKIQTYTVTFDPSSVAANTTEEKTVTVTGLSTNDLVFINKPSHQAGLGIVNCRVSAANTLAVTFMNATGSPIDPSSEDYFLISVRR